MPTNNVNDSSINGIQGREATPEEIARRDGYVQGRNDENYVQGSVRAQERAAAQTAANDGAASGLIVGLMIALLAGAVGAAVYFLSTDSTTPVVAPEVEQAPKVEREIIKEKTIIERNNTTTPAPTPEVNVETAPAPAPDVNIINQEPAPAEPAPATEPAAESTEQPATEPATN